MDERQIAEMVKSLTNAGLVPPERKEDAKVVLAAYWTDQIALTWTVNDVLDVCPGLTEEEARHVLWEARHKHDASIGVNWDVLLAHGIGLYADRAVQNPEGDDDEDY